MINLNCNKSFILLLIFAIGKNQQVAAMASPLDIEELNKEKNSLTVALRPEDLKSFYPALTPAKEKYLWGYKLFNDLRLEDPSQPLSADDIKKNRSKGFSLITQAAQDNLAAAQRTLGLIYFDGAEGIVKTDYKKAFTWLEKASASDQGHHGDIPAFVQLFLKPFYNDKGPQETEKIFNKIPEWKEQITNPFNKNFLISISYDPDVCFALFKLYEDGHVFKKDLQLSHNYVINGSTLGVAQCQEELGERYKYGDRLEPNIDEAVYWLKLAAQAGDEKARLELAGVYTYNQKYLNLREGFQILNQLAQNGYKPAYNLLGDLAFEGCVDADFREDPDYKKAFEFYSKGDELALFHLAELYADGLGTPQNEQEAQHIYDKILASANPDLFETQGIMYEEGIGTKQDLERAQELYKKDYTRSDFSKERYDFLENQKLKKEKEHAEAQKKEKKKTKNKPTQMLQEKAGGSSSSSGLIADIDVAGEALKSALQEIHVPDASAIESIDTARHTITLSGAANKSHVQIMLERWPQITQADITSFKFPALDKRIRYWLETPESDLLKTHAQVDIDRHRLPLRVIQILDLYGKKTYFPRRGKVIKNLTLPAQITFKDGRILKGTLEQALYVDTHQSDTLYHLFLAPRTKAVSTYKEAKEKAIA